MTDTIEPITRAGRDADWDGAIWVGEVDERHLDSDGLKLAGGESFQCARLLVWANDQPRGYVEVAVDDGVVNAEDVRQQLSTLPEPLPRSAAVTLPPMSVVVCTRDHPDHLTSLLDSLTRLEYPEFEVIVVDNNPSSGLTRRVVDDHSALPVRVVDAPGEGLSIARNVGLNHACFDFVAFTDDDVVVDRRWLRNLAYGFEHGPRVGCVCGLVPSAEVLTPSQSYFDRRVDWARRCDSARYDIASPEDDDLLFPFHVGLYGTGANFAVRKGVVTDLGGFDEALGIGSPAQSGEDLDMFIRILLGGYQLAREPSAVVWHRHRSTVAELDTQIYSYGVGLGAWAFKMLTKPRTFGMVMNRVLPGIRHLRTVTAVGDAETDDSSDPTLKHLCRREFQGVLHGPVALLRGRVAGRHATPLKPFPHMLRAFDFRRGTMWGDPGNVVVEGRFALAAVVLGLIGMLGAIRSLPTLLLALVVTVFMFGGPGALAASWYPRLSTSALVALIPTVSLSVCIVGISSLLLFVRYYNPPVVLLGLASCTALGGLVRCGYLSRRREVEP